MKKKILIFSSAFSPFEGGAEIALKEICNRNQDFDFDMITLRYNKNLPRAERIGNITVYRVGYVVSNPSMADLLSPMMRINKIFFAITGFLKAQELHQKNKYDAIWAMMAAYAGFTAMIFKLFNQKIPYLLTLQEGDPIEEIKAKIKYVKPLFKRIFTSATMIQVISTYLLEYARMMGYQGEVRVVPNAVDINIFSKNISKDRLSDLRKNLGLENSDLVLVTTSRLVKKNGIDDIIRSLRRLESNVKFLVIGEGPDEKKLKELCRALSLEPRVVWLGKLDHEKMVEYLNMSDIFIRPSLSEGLGNSFLEAMAVGIPVVATEVGGIKDFLFAPHNKTGTAPTGLFCQVKDPRSISAMVKLLKDNDVLRKEITQNAKDMVAKKFTWTKVAEDMNKIFKKISDSNAI